MFSAQLRRKTKIAFAVVGILTSPIHLGLELVPVASTMTSSQSLATTHHLCQFLRNSSWRCLKWISCLAYGLGMSLSKPTPSLHVEVTIATILLTTTPLQKHGGEIPM
uniref:Uncharacterized protein n=1 Tax=Opuntia streptacantha TaxID=393608 RepID=A0A7C9AJ30_OPUST